MAKRKKKSATPPFCTLVVPRFLITRTAGEDRRVFALLLLLRAV